MQSNSGHCSEFHVSGEGNLRSASAYSGSLGPLMELVQVAAWAAWGAASAHSSASPTSNPTPAPHDRIPLTPKMPAEYSSRALAVISRASPARDGACAKAVQAPARKRVEAPVRKGVRTSTLKSVQALADVGPRR
jgi:hypothetical protein